MKAKTTHIGKLRAAYTCNQQHIRAAFGWDEGKYTDQWLDMGRAFLDGHYPRGDADYAASHRTIAADRKFWQWWLAEWKQREAYCVRMFSKANAPLTPREYLSVMACLPDDGYVEAGFFENYLYKLKPIKNGSNPDKKQAAER